MTIDHAVKKLMVAFHLFVFIYFVFIYFIWKIWVLGFYPWSMGKPYSTHNEMIFYIKLTSNPFSWFTQPKPFNLVWIWVNPWVVGLCPPLLISIPVRYIYFIYAYIYFADLQFLIELFVNLCLFFYTPYNRVCYVVWFYSFKSKYFDIYVLLTSTYMYLSIWNKNFTSLSSLSIFWGKTSTPVTLFNETM